MENTATYPAFNISATYCPEDNKIRLYPSTRLDPETYQRVKAAGFAWAPKQELFVAPMWTPAREDLAIELAGEIEDEATPLAERAAKRAERFEGYQGKRAADADRARRAVSAIANNIPLGQPILVGHHSERHARKDAERIQNGMRKAVQMWRTSEYWKERAVGALAHAQYKEIPAVRARRIKKLEAELRGHERDTAKALAALKAWNDKPVTMERALAITNVSFMSGSFPLDKFPRNPSASQYEGPMSYWSALDQGIITPEYARDQAIQMHERNSAHHARWISHLAMRLEYERTLLGESGYKAPPKKASRAEKPILNYPGKVIVRSRYSNDVREVELVGITKAEFAKLWNDYKGTAFSADGTHRVRTAMLGGVHKGISHVYLTDSKIHTPPTADESKASAEAHEKAAQDAADRKMREKLAELNAKEATAPAREAARAEQKAKAAPFEAMAEGLRNGIQVVSAPQLFPTPPELAERMAELADLKDGLCVLEPSAGTGNLIKAVLDRVDTEVLAYEVSRDLCSHLARTFPDYKAKAVCRDFLDVTDYQGCYPRIMMNPPFADGADIVHIKHAITFLAPGGKLVALCAAGPRQERDLKPLADSWELIEGAFAAQGTNVRVALLTITRKGGTDGLSE